MDEEREGMFVCVYVCVCVCVVLCLREKCCIKKRKKQVLRADKVVTSSPPEIPPEKKKEIGLLTTKDRLPPSLLLPHCFVSKRTSVVSEWYKVRGKWGIFFKLFRNLKAYN